jgi:hypothetical protein
MAIDKYNLNLAGEYRVAAELLKRNLFATVTYGNKKGADIFAIGSSRCAAVIEVKASNSRRFVTKFYQKYPDPAKPHPDFWVLYSVRESDAGFEERFFVLSHEELAQAQGRRNCPGQSLSYAERAARARKGVDNVLIQDVEPSENKWDKIISFCKS